MRSPLFFCLAGAAAVCALSSCATRPTIYKAPDAARVTASTKKLSAAIAKSEETRIRAEAKLQDSQASFDRVAGHSATVLSLIKELEPFIPAEQRPKFDELKKSADAQVQEEGVLSDSIEGARGEVAQLKKDHAVEVQARDQLVVEQARYQADAQKIADDATEESRQKVAYKDQLASEKRSRWIWRILGGGSLVALVVGVIALFVTGKLSIAAIRAYF
jgi:hypothetical protein